MVIIVDTVSLTRNAVMMRAAIPSTTYKLILVDSLKSSIHVQSSIDDKGVIITKPSLIGE